MTFLSRTNRTDRYENQSEMVDFLKCKKVLGDLADKEVINLSYYGIPTNNAVCIGCQWEQGDFDYTNKDKELEEK